jgi:hypothetical protein
MKKTRSQQQKKLQKIFSHMKTKKNTVEQPVDHRRNKGVNKKLLESNMKIKNK